MFNLITPRRRWPYILGLIVFACIMFGVGGFVWFKNKDLIDIAKSSFVQKIIRNQVGDAAANAVALLPEMLGYTEPRTYLFLFENNTELRPGGGFIGTYALVRLEQGHVALMHVEGSDILDARAPKDLQSTAPAPYVLHLGVDKLYFRDSNWSPDWQESAKKALELYKAEGGTGADDIDAVIGVTPTILEELLRLTGPLTIDGITFSDSDVVEKLEYEVEYGFQDRGLSVEDRKQIIRPLLQSIFSDLNSHILLSYKKYVALAQRLVEEKQVMMYALDPKLQPLVTQFKSGGEVATTTGDYLLWVDANLAALKTDHAIVRNLSYKIMPDGDDGYRATAAMTYKHIGTFDWRTTRYRTYARVFVPKGATLLSIEGSMKTDRSSEIGKIDQGEELGKQWFGTFISIEPGKTGTLLFMYKLPKDVSDMIKNGSYSLLVQKQLGSGNNGLTLDLNFDRTSVASTPEDAGVQGDGRYEYTGDLRVDRAVTLSF